VFPLDQRDILRAWRIRCRVIGQDIARLSIADDNIIVLLHRLTLCSGTRCENYLGQSGR